MTNFDFLSLSNLDWVGVIPAKYCASTFHFTELTQVGGEDIKFDTFCTKG